MRGISETKLNQRDEGEGWRWQFTW